MESGYLFDVLPFAFVRPRRWGCMVAEIRMAITRIGFCQSVEGGCLRKMR